jgi:hypothetical protein
LALFFAPISAASAVARPKRWLANGIRNAVNTDRMFAAAPRVAPVADVACALAAAGLALGSTIANWDSADDPTPLPKVKEPLPGAPHCVFIPAILQGQSVRS